MVVLVTLTTLTGIAAWQLRGPSYTATSTVTVAPITTEHFGKVPPAGVISMVTEVRTATSTPVLARAAALISAGLSPVTAGQLAAGVSVTSPKDSLLLLITATAKDPGQASAWSAAVAKGYLEQRSRDAREDVATVSASLEAQAASLEASLLRGGSDQAAKSAIRAALAKLRVQRAVLASAAAVPGRISSNAQPPSHHSSPAVWIFALGGLALGLLTAPLLSLVVERLRRTIGSRHRLTDLLTDGWVCGDGTAGTAEVLAAAAQQLTADPLTVRCTKPQHANGQASILVSVLDLTTMGGTAGTVTRGLADQARADGWRTGTTTAADLMASVLSGQPGPAADELTVVALTDGSAHGRSTASARLAALVLIAVTPRTRHAGVREFIHRVEADGGRVAGAILLPHHRPAREPVEAIAGNPVMAWRSAVAEP